MALINYQVDEQPAFQFLYTHQKQIMYRRYLSI